MMKELKGKLAIDTSALIELIYCDSLGQKLKKALETDMVEAYTRVSHYRATICPMQKTWMATIKRKSRKTPRFRIFYG